MSGCAKPKPAEPVTAISGDIVHDDSGNETAMLADVIVLHNHNKRPFMDLGFVDSGKLDISFPDPDKLTNFFEKVDFELPGIQIEPQDAVWLPLDDSKAIFAFTDEKTEGIFGGETTQNYTLELSDRYGIVKVMFACFAQDTTAKGKGRVMEMYDYDIDINAAKGWNMIYVRRSDSGVSMKTFEKDTAGIKWFATRSTWGM
jgi:hypothetical protein